MYGGNRRTDHGGQLRPIGQKPVDTMSSTTIPNNGIVKALPDRTSFRDDKGIQTSSLLGVTIISNNVTG